MDHMTGTIYKHEEQLALYDVHYTTQAQETKAIREAVTEASMELEVLLELLQAHVVVEILGY